MTTKIIDESFRAKVGVRKCTFVTLGHCFYFSRPQRMSEFSKTFFGKHRYHISLELYFIGGGHWPETGPHTPRGAA